MERSQLVEQLEELNYILGKISRYRKQNQYVYPRPFASWQEEYNDIVVRLREARVLSASVFALAAKDMSPSGKSVLEDAVERLIRAIGHQASRLEEKIAGLDRAGGDGPALSSALERYFPRGDDGTLHLPQVEERAFAVVCSGEDGARLLREGIGPVLRSQGIPWAGLDRAPADDTDLGDLVRTLYSSRLVILDLTGQSPQVMFALGLAYALGRETILLRPRGDEDTVEAYYGRCLNYTGTDQLRVALGEMLRGTGTAGGENQSEQEEPL